MSSILITGATGYFGRGYVRYLMDHTEVKRICIFSRDEAKQAQMRQSIEDPQQRLHWFIGDIRDQQRLRRALQDVDAVVHAAALKRVEVGEYNPMEMVKTNILGTMNLIEAAQDAGVERVVYLSSDKACAPRNAYGATKFASEKLILAANNTRGKIGPIYAVTRYGNVAGSTWSVIPTWRASKGVIYLSDLEVTRFWMTLQQAIDLVHNTLISMKGGELNVPDLPAYRLGDLADAMGISPTRIMITGLGSGEKMHERMLEDGLDSSQVRRMTIEELREGLENL